MKRVLAKNQKAVSAFLTKQTHQQYHTQNSVLTVATNARTRVTPTSLNSKVYENPNAKRVVVEKKYLRKAQDACDKRNPETVETAVQNIIDDLRINNIPVPSIEIFTQCINALVKSQKSDKAHKYYDMMMQHYSLTQIPFSLLVFMINACKYKKEEVRAVDYFSQFKEKLKLHDDVGDSIPHRDEIITRAYTNLINSMSNVLDKEKCDLYFEEFKSTYGEDKVDYSLYGCMMKVNSFLQNYDECAKIMDTIKERVYTIIPTGTDMTENNPSTVLTLFYNMMITSCQTLEQTEIVRKQMEDEQITYDHQTYVNLLKKYLQFDEYNKMYDLYENQFKATSIRAKEPVFFLLLEACYRESFQRAEHIRGVSGNEISKAAIFDMNRIKGYWSEMRNKYGNKEPSDVMVDALRRIVQENKQYKKEYRTELKNLFKKQKHEKIEQLKTLQNEEKKQK